MPTAPDTRVEQIQTMIAGLTKIYCDLEPRRA